ncbi:MAG: hypothetical protein ACKVT1_08795 [Dehalococcoidia bacterium]
MSDPRRLTAGKATLDEPRRLRRLDCVGESKFQDALVAIAGGKRRESQQIETNAEVRREPDNAFDANAIQVFIAGKLVAYLPRELAAQYAPRFDAKSLGGMPCPAEIRGGWRDGGGEGSFGVRVWLP